MMEPQTSVGAAPPSQDVSPRSLRQHGLRYGVLGRVLDYHATIGSTNEKARALAAAGWPEGTVVLAEEQTSGRGRKGRLWHSPRGEGIFLSVLLRPPGDALEVARLTLVAGVAVVEAVEATTGVRLGLKWPNDLLYGGAKVGGILTENTSGGQVIIGIGINANQTEFPSELKNKATSLLLAAGHPVDRAAIAVALLQHLEALYGAFLGGALSSILDDWRRYSVTLGQRVRVVIDQDVLEGVAVDIDDHGALILEVEEEGVARTERLWAGEITMLRPV